MTTIERWTLVQHGAHDYRVHGRAVDGCAADGGRMRTSAIVAFDEATRTVVTRSGSRYQLGTPAPEGDHGSLLYAPESLCRGCS